MAPKTTAKTTAKKATKKVVEAKGPNPLFPARPKNFRIGGDIRVWYQRCTAPQ